MRHHSILEKLINFRPVPSNNKADLENLFQLESNDVDFIVLLFDNDGLSVGKKIKLDMSAYKDTMAIYRWKISKKRYTNK